MLCGNSLSICGQHKDMVPTGFTQAVQNLCAVADEEEEEEEEEGEKRNSLPLQRRSLSPLSESQRDKSPPSVIICDFLMRYKSANANECRSSL